MKKILLLVSGLALSASVFATDNDFALATGGTAGSTTLVSKTANEACDALATETDTVPVKVGLSKENYGHVACSTTDIAVSVTSPKGKGKVYSSSSGGGSLVESDCATATDCKDTDVSGKATELRTAAGGST